MEMKLLLTWDLRPGQEAEYFQFVVKEFAPAMAALGLQLTDAWYTIYGDAPQILIGAVATEQTMEQALQSPDWEDLLRRLKRFVVNYRQRVVPSTGRFQM